ncbi:tail tape measure protein, partial [Escherichia coli]
IPAYAQALTAGTQIISAIRGIAFGGGRYNGGAVNGGKLYRVGERGVPELFTSTGGKQYMIPGEGGRVTPGRDLVGGGGITMNNTFNIQANNGWTEEDSKALQQTIENTAMRLMQRESQRPGGILQPRRR